VCGGGVLCLMFWSASVRSWLCLLFAALALNCASGTGDFMFVPYLRPTMRCTALHFLAAVFFLTLVFIRHLAQCGICIAMEFQFYYPIPTTKPYLTQDLHPTKPTNTLTPHIRPASTGLSVLTPTDKARIISAERHFRTRPGPPTSQIPHLTRRTRKSRPLESFAIRIPLSPRTRTGRHELTSSLK
jgi:hypothetical protein